MSQIAKWEESSLNLELFFCTDVLKLNSLHYGYWDVKEEMDLVSVKNAQARYTETLTRIIPEDVETILDVGCGVGDVASALAQRGHTVTAISPDKNHAKFFKDRNGEKVHFHNIKFEKFESDRKFDLVLMSESQNYFDMDIGFDQCKKHLRQGGYLLVSGMFKKGDTGRFKGCHIEDKYVRRAGSHNLALEKCIDITENVLPTLEFVDQFYKEYLTPSLKVLSCYLGNRLQIKLKLLKLLFAKEFRQLAKVREYYEERSNSDLFREHVKYLRLLFVYKGEKKPNRDILRKPSEAETANRK
jgi:2-polyprenyl-3-methyl-5-hydroxy-6-metoxy-1,4-benzoquinol methylase